MSVHEFRPRGQVLQLTRGAVLTALILISLGWMHWFRLGTGMLQLINSVVLVTALLALNRKGAICVFLSSALLALFLFPSIHTVLYITFFGSYPLIKAFFDQRFLQIQHNLLVKFLYFFFLSLISAWIMHRIVYFGYWNDWGPGLSRSTRTLILPILGPIAFEILGFSWDFLLTFLAPRIGSYLKFFHLK